MFAMGIGSYLSKFFMKNLVTSFIIVEIVISLIGGLSSILLFMAFPLITAMYSLIMYSLILIIGTLVGFEIPILTRILSRKDSLRQSIANVLSLDYTGALIGSVLFPLVLLPQLGLVRSSFAIGLINASTAVVNTIFFKSHLKYPKTITAISVFFLGLLIILTALGTHLTKFAENHLYFDQIIYKKQTHYQKIVYTQSLITGEHRLFIDGHIQFCDRDEYRYHEALVHPVMSLPGSRENILVLGGGDGMAIREILKYPQVKRIHLVDIDPEITRFCSTFPEITRINKGSLKDPKVSIFNEDAFTYANRPGTLYDRIIIDLPDPHNEALNKLYSREYYKILKMRMNTGSYMVTQSSSPFYTRKSFWCIEKTMQNASLSTYSYKVTVPTFGIWGFHIGSVSGKIPDTFDIQVPTQFLNTTTMKFAGIFENDIARLNVPVNSIMEPKLYILYLQELTGSNIN